MLTYVGYKAGKGTVVDPLEQQVKQLIRAINTQSLFGVEIPRKIKWAKRMRRAMMGIGVSAVIALAVVYQWLPEW